MTKKITWRLKEPPTAEKLLELVKANLLTKEEAREILFENKDTSERDEDSLKAEISFLRELVERLANRSQIVESIRYIERPYSGYKWVRPYEIWCGSVTMTNTAQAFNSISTF